METPLRQETNRGLYDYILRLFRDAVNKKDVDSEKYLLVANQIKELPITIDSREMAELINYIDEELLEKISKFLVYNAPPPSIASVKLDTSSESILEWSEENNGFGILLDSHVNIIECTNDSEININSKQVDLNDIDDFCDFIFGSSDEGGNIPLDSVDVDISNIESNTDTSQVKLVPSLEIEEGKILKRKLSQVSIGSDYDSFTDEVGSLSGVKRDLSDKLIYSQDNSRSVKKRRVVLEEPIIIDEGLDEEDILNTQLVIGEYSSSSLSLSKSSTLSLSKSLNTENDSVSTSDSLDSLLSSNYVYQSVYNTSVYNTCSQSIPNDSSINGNAVNSINVNIINDLENGKISSNNNKLDSVKLTATSSINSESRINSSGDITIDSNDNGNDNGDGFVDVDGGFMFDDGGFNDNDQYMNDQFMEDGGFVFGNDPNSQDFIFNNLNSVNTNSSNLNSSQKNPTKKKSSKTNAKTKNPVRNHSISDSDVISVPSSLSPSNLSQSRSQLLSQSNSINPRLQGVKLPKPDSGSAALLIALISRCPDILEVLRGQVSDTYAFPALNKVELEDIAQGFTSVPMKGSHKNFYGGFSSMKGHVNKGWVTTCTKERKKMYQLTVIGGAVAAVCYEQYHLAKHGSSLESTNTSSAKTDNTTDSSKNISQRTENNSSSNMSENTNEKVKGKAKKTKQTEEMQKVLKNLPTLKNYHDYSDDCEERVCDDFYPSATISNNHVKDSNHSTSQHVITGDSISTPLSPLHPTSISTSTSTSTNFTSTSTSTPTSTSMPSTDHLFSNTCRCSQCHIPSSPLWLSPSHELVLLIDTHEVRSDNALLYQRLADSPGINVEQHVLSVGDFMFALRDPVSKQLYCGNTIIERKSVSDLFSSIRDGRYKDQRYRLRKSQIPRVCFLIEGEVKGEDAPGPSAVNMGNIHRTAISTQALETAIADINLCDGFAILQSQGLNASIEYLVDLYHELKKYYLQGHFRLQCTHYKEILLGDVLGEGELFDTFQLRLEKQADTTNFLTFARQIKQIRGLNDHAAMAIAQKYHSFSGLLNAYRVCGGNSENAVYFKQHMLAQLPYAGRKLSKLMSARIYQTLCVDHSPSTTSTGTGTDTGNSLL